MTREEARQNLVALGIEEPTDVQVTNYLNQFHANRNQNQQVANNNPGANQVTQQGANAEPHVENEELENLRQQIANLQRENSRKDIEAYAISKGLTGDQVKNILNAFGENVDVAKQAIDSIGQIISDNRTAAAREKEQELANGASNPGGGNAGTHSGDEKPDDVKNAESIVFGGLPQNSQTTRDFYK